MTQPKQSDESFEHSLQQLANIVRDLEDGNLTLDESLSRYEDGIRFLNQCQQMLSEAERKIDVLRGFDADGNPITEPLDDVDMSLEEKADSRSQRRSAHTDVPQSIQPPAHDHKSPGAPSKNDDVDFRETLF